MAATLFFLPGLRGDEQKGMDFRARFGDQFHFVLLKPPDLSAEASILVDIVAMAELAAGDVEKHQPEGEIRMIGFSFGGCIAYEVCRILLARGRQIAFLGLIDAPLLRMIEHGKRRPEPQLRSAAVAGLRLLTQRESVLRSLLGTTRRLQPARLASLQWFLIGFLRRQAVSRWNPKPLALPHGLVIISESFFAQTSSRWRTLMPAATLVHLPVEHVTVLDARSIDTVFEVFAKAMVLPGAQRDGLASSRRA